MMVFVVKPRDAVAPGLQDLKVAERINSALQPVASILSGIFMLRFTLILLILQTVNAFAQPDTLWTRIYESEGGFGEVCYTGTKTNDDGYMLGGNRYSYEYRNNMHVKKVDSLGVLEWTSTFITPSSGYFFSLVQHFEGSYYGTGMYKIRNLGGNYGYLLKFDEHGDSLWTALLGGYPSEMRCLVLSRDSSIVVGGDTSELARFGGIDGFMAKIDTDGEEIWSSVFGGNSNERIQGMTNTSDGGYALCGETQSYGNGLQFYLVKTDSMGEVEWSNAYGDSLADVSFDVVQCRDGGYALTGKSYHYDGGMRSYGYIVKTDSEGNELWSRRYGRGRTESFNDIICTEDNGLVAGGKADWERSPMYIVRTDSLGEVLWTGYYSLDRSQDECKNIIQHEDFSFTILGQVDGYSNMGIIKTEPDPVYNNVELLDPAFPQQFTVHDAYPNPFNSTLRISFDVDNTRQVNLSVFDVSGRKVSDLISKQYEAGAYNFVWSAEHQPTGMYFLRMSSKGDVITRKITLIK